MNIWLIINSICVHSAHRHDSKGHCSIYKPQHASESAHHQLELLQRANRRSDESALGRSMSHLIIQAMHSKQCRDIVLISNAGSPVHCDVLIQQRLLTYKNTAQLWMTRLQRRSTSGQNGCSAAGPLGPSSFVIAYKKLQLVIHLLGPRCQGACILLE